MSLRNIVADIAADIGIAISNTNELALTVARLNEQAHELWQSCDLPGSLREQVFAVDDAEASIFTLPHYVDKIRGLRYRYYGGSIPPEDMSPRYSYGSFNADCHLRHRILSTRATEVDFTNVSALTFTLPKVEMSDISITLTGKTDNSNRVTEQVVIPAGALTAISLNNYYDENLQIEKRSVNTYDIAVSDINDVAVSTIPNDQLSPRYTTVSVSDGRCGAGLNHNCQGLEFLFKPRFTPFRTNYDEFQAPNCDKILYWKYMESYASKQPGMETRAIMAASKAQQLITQLQSDDNKGKHLQMDFGRDRSIDLQRPVDWGYANTPMRTI